MTPALPPIARRIKAAVAASIRDGLEPKTLYLTPDDREELLRELRKVGAWYPGDPEPEEIGGLQLRRLSGRGHSRVYCRHGIARQLPVQAPP
jgi:hypothetical protein